MARLSLTFAGVVALSLSLGATASAQKSTGTPAQYQQAYAVAQQALPDAQLIKSRLEQGGKLYGFYFWKDGKVYELEVNAAGLKVVKNVVQDDGNKDKVSPDVVKLIGQQKAAKTKLPEGRLLEIAADALKETGISEVKYAVNNGKLVFQIGDLVLDAATGKPVKK